MSQFDPDLSRPLPQNPEAERAVIGSVLTNPHNFWEVCDIVGEADFFKESHRIIWRAIVAICEEARTDLDTLTLKHDLANNAALNQAGGHAYISSLTDGIPDVTNVVRYAQIVKEKADLRRIIVQCNAAMRRALDVNDGPALIASETASELQGLAVAPRKQSRSMSDVAREVAQRRQARKAEGRSRVVLTGFPTLDFHRVLRRKATTLLMAPTSQGKSTFMLNLMTGAMKSDSSVRSVFYSLEMSDEDVLDPVIAMLSRVPLDFIQDEVMSDEQKERVGQAYQRVHEWRERMFFADLIRDMDALYADCRRRKATTGLDVIFVDYLQLIRERSSRISVEQQIDAAGRALLGIAQDLDIAVAFGSQVSREYQKRASGRLSIFDAEYGKVSGEHARVALMWQCSRQADKSNREIPWCQCSPFQVEKNSGRETGDVKMHVDFRTQTFEEGDCPSVGCSLAPASPLFR